MNSVNLIGRLGQDPETRSTTTGTPVSNFRIAVQRNKETADWFSVVAFNKTAELAQNFLKKGSKIGIEGRLQNRVWEKDGQKNTVTEIIANRIEFLDPKPTEVSAGTGSYVPTDEDVPF